MVGVGCCWLVIGTRREGIGMTVRVMVRIGVRVRVRVKVRTGVIIQLRGRQVIGIVAASDSA